MVDRNPRLLKMAQNRPCLLRLDVCVGGGETTVAAHSNSQEHGKGMGIKANDQWSVWACGACHAKLDQGKMTKAERRAAFERAHERQMVAWGRIAKDWREDVKDREAAQWAIRKVRVEQHRKEGVA